MKNSPLTQEIFRKSKQDAWPIFLENGSRVAVIGGGPAGSLFSYFLLSMAKQIDLKISVDIYEPRDFNIPGPLGCNMCGGVLYESLVQSLAMEGINLPTTVVQRGIEYNTLHLDSGTGLIRTPQREKRIAATFRGVGPRGMLEAQGGSLDRYLLQAAQGQGAQHVRNRVEEVRWAPVLETGNDTDKRIEIKAHGTEFRTYDFVAVATGVNTALLKQFVSMDFGYYPPQTTKLVVREYFLGEETVSKYFGPAFHAFLLDIPGLDYGAIIPKGDYVTMCLLSSHKELHTDAMELFLNNPAVKRILPPEFSQHNVACLCGPRINIQGSRQPYGDRIVFIGDSGVSRLYKDGIGAAYRTAKMAAGTAIFHGISGHSFKNYYLPFCRKMERDNQVGKLLFKAAGLFQKTKIGQRTILKMISLDQGGIPLKEQNISMVLWDMLTGGAPYLDVLLRTLHPVFLARLLYHLLQTFVHLHADYANNELFDFTAVEHAAGTNGLEESVRGVPGALGKVYQHGDVIVRQGEVGNSMYVIQDGYVEVVKETDSQEIQLAVLGKDEFFGEMAIFEKEVRGATVRVVGAARILTIDSKNLLRRIHEDPSLAYRLVQVMSGRIRRLGDNYASFSNAIFKNNIPPASLDSFSKIEKNFPSWNKLP